MHHRFIVSVLALSISCATHAASFSGTYFFGDSLTDSGAYAGLVPAGGKFTTNPGLVWSEFLANAYGTSATANNPNNPTILSPGTNYAQGGAQVNTGPGYGGSIATTALSVHQQVTNFLAANPSADSNALFGLWAGANDIFYQLQFAGTLSQAATFAAANNFAAAQAAANVALTQANSTTNSTRQLTMQAVANAALTAAQGNSAAGVATAAQQASGVAQQFVGMAAAETVTEIARLKAAGVKYIIVPNLPDMGATPAGVASGPTAQASLTSLSGLYNTLLADGLRQANLEVISLNVNGVMKEILANSTAYGITNTTTPACNTSSSLICTPADLAAADAASTYFFADGVHPTTAVHQILSQYAMAVMDAPTQMAQLPNVALQNARSQQTMFDDRLRLLRSGSSRKKDALDLFINVSGVSADQTQNNGALDTSGSQRNVTIGGDRLLGSVGHMGFAVAISSSSHDFGSNHGGFDLNEAAFSVYGGVISSGFYTQGYAQLGVDHYDNISRNIQLGATTRTETSEARGTRFAAGVNGGYSWSFKQFNTGPLLGLQYNTTTVKGFQENEGDSLSMSYAKQGRESLIGSLGWSADMKLEADGNTWLPFAQLVYDHEFAQSDREVSANLSSASTRFSMPIAAPEEANLHYKLGVVADFKTWKGSLSYTGVTKMDDGDYKAFNLTLSKNF